VPDFTKPRETTAEDDARARAILDAVAVKRCACTCGTSAVPKRCDHAFGGWREHKDGQGGEQVCERCGVGAMWHTLKAC